MLKQTGRTTELPEGAGSVSVGSHSIEVVCGPTASSHTSMGTGAGATTATMSSIASAEVPVRGEGEEGARAGGAWPKATGSRGQCPEGPVPKHCSQEERPHRADKSNISSKLNVTATPSSHSNTMVWKEGGGSSREGKTGDRA